MKIITHHNPDLDAVVGIYLFVKLNNLRNWEVAFLPENGDVYIDCSPEQKTDHIKIYDHHEKDSKFKSATEAVFENCKSFDSNLSSAYKILVNIVNEIDTAQIVKNQDAMKYKPLMLMTYISYLNSKRNFTKTYWDKLFEFLDASVETITHAEKAKSVNIDCLTINGYKIAFYDVTNKNVNPAPFCFKELNADFVVFKNGLNLGITKNLFLENISLEPLKAMIDEDGWYVHPKGFVVAHGTSKHPAKKKSKYDIPHLLNFLSMFLTKLNYKEVL